MLTDRVAIGAMAAGLLSSTIGFSFRQSLTNVLDPYENPRFSEILSPLPPFTVAKQYFDNCQQYLLSSS